MRNFLATEEDGKHVLCDWDKEIKKKKKNLKMSGSQNFDLKKKKSSVSQKICL